MTACRYFKQVCMVHVVSDVDLFTAPSLLCCCYSQQGQLLSAKACMEAKAEKGIIYLCLPCFT